MPQKYEATVKETGDSEIAIFHEVAQKGFQFEPNMTHPSQFPRCCLLKEFKHRYAVNAYSINDVDAPLITPFQGDHGHLIPRRNEKVGFISHPHVLRIETLHQHQNSTSTFVH